MMMMQKRNKRLAVLGLTLTFCAVSCHASGGETPAKLGKALGLRVYTVNERYKVDPQTLKKIKDPDTGKFISDRDKWVPYDAYDFPNDDKPSVTQIASRFGKLILTKINEDFRVDYERKLEYKRRTNQRFEEKYQKYKHLYDLPKMCADRVVYVEKKYVVEVTNTEASNLVEHCIQKRNEEVAVIQEAEAKKAEDLKHELQARARQERAKIERAARTMVPSGPVQFHRTKDPRIIRLPKKKKITRAAATCTRRRRDAARRAAAAKRRPIISSTQVKALLDKQHSSLQPALAMKTSQALVPVPNQKRITPAVKKYFKVFGLGTDANFEQVKEIHKTKAREFHPDMKFRNNSFDEKKFKEMQEAYENLANHFKDKEKKIAGKVLRITQEENTNTSSPKATDSEKIGVTARIPTVSAGVKCATKSSAAEMLQSHHQTIYRLWKDFLNSNTTHKVKLLKGCLNIKEGTKVRIWKRLDSTHVGVIDENGKRLRLKDCDLITLPLGTYSTGPTWVNHIINGFSPTRTKLISAIKEAVDDAKKDKRKIRWKWDAVEKLDKECYKTMKMINDRSMSSFDQRNQLVTLMQRIKLPRKEEPVSNPPEPTTGTEKGDLAREPPCCTICEAKKGEIAVVKLLYPKSGENLVEGEKAKVVSDLYDGLAKSEVVTVVRFDGDKVVVKNSEDLEHEVQKSDLKPLNQWEDPVLEGTKPGNVKLTLVKVTTIDENSTETNVSVTVADTGVSLSVTPEERRKHFKTLDLFECASCGNVTCEKCCAGKASVLKHRLCTLFQRYNKICNRCGVTDDGYNNPFIPWKPAESLAAQTKNKRKRYVNRQKMRKERIEPLYMSSNEI